MRFFLSLELSIQASEPFVLMYYCDCLQMTFKIIIPSIHAWILLLLRIESLIKYK